MSVGGDGTLHNVVNGIMLQGYVKISDISIALIPLVTGNDWIKTYRIKNNFKKAVEIIH
ncbi:acylglycerol kinase family protein [Polaribacter sp.]|nr:acylglycerol kinase family protein [Polaribacter sp.]